jgi:hypothetical protein
VSNAPAHDDDDDMSATFRVMKEASQEKRRSNLDNSTKLLRERGITFDVYNNGVHLVIRSGERTWDFWPSTGKYRERRNHFAPGSFAMNAQSKTSGRGVFNLLRAIGEQKR